MQPPPLFGSPLVTALARSSFTTPSGLSIPGILGRCYQEIEERGLDIEGIFRKSGSTAAVNELQTQFEENSNPFLVKLSPTISTHSLAALFKRYLQQLPEPVIPRQHQPLFLNVFDEEKYTRETMRRKLKEVCKELPHEHLHLLQFLIEVAHAVQQRQDKNQMSIESLAIIFAPTCVRIDGVSQLLPDAKQNKSAYSFNASSCPSYTSLPIMMNKQQLFRRARDLLINVVRKKQSSNKLTYGSKRNSFSSNLLYKPSELLQLELVKEGNTWIKIFEFMMSYPEVFTTLTNPLKSQQYVRPIMPDRKSTNNMNMSVEKESLPSITANTAASSPKPKSDPLSLWVSPFSQQEKKLLIDFSALEFTESHDLVKTFENFEFKVDHILSPTHHNKDDRHKLLSTSATKYVKTLQSWKSREEENPTIVIPQEVIIGSGHSRKRSTRYSNRSSISSRAASPQPTDYAKTMSNHAVFAAEPNEKTGARYPIF